MKTFDVSAFRQQFPILDRKINGHALVYFDNAATSQKPLSVINAVSNYEKASNANVHRASHSLSSEATSAFELSREKVKCFINANSIEEIIWTKGSTESINLVAQAWGREHLSHGDEILLSYGEHHANIVPWQMVAEQTGAQIKVLPLDDAGRIDIKSLDDYISDKTKVVAINHISNVIGKINPIESVISKAKAVGAKTLIDGAQAVAHINVDVQKLDCDFYVFSAHKMHGPAGVGVLYGKKAVLDIMPPYQAGGEMIKHVSFAKTEFNVLPFKFEAGTPNISGIIGLGEAIDFISLNNNIERAEQLNYEHELIDYCYQQLSAIDELSFIVKQKPDIGIFSFTIKQQHNQDIASALDAYGIAVRSGHHCAMPLMAYLALSGCVRFSLAAYNTKEEIDFAVKQLKIICTGDSLVSHAQYDEMQVNHIVAQFEKAKSWDSKHREIMLFGKKLHRLAADSKHDGNIITGCESAAWLVHTLDAENRFHFQADSEAKVIRGLLYIVLAKYQHLTSAEILEVNIEEYFDGLGLLQHLSPSRGNGLKAIVERIKEMAKKAL